PLSPREERAGRESERGEIDKKHLLSPALSSFLRRRGRENAVTRSKQIFCRTQLLGDPCSGGSIKVRPQSVCCFLLTSIMRESFAVQPPDANDQSDHLRSRQLPRRGRRGGGCSHRRLRPSARP